jgi:magnesium-transporting ATPase (P-type)
MKCLINYLSLSTPPALGLGVEPADKKIMHYPPSKSKQLFTKEVIMDIASLRRFSRAELH